MIGSMEIHDDVMLGSCLCSTLIEAHHPLVLAVHEVNLHTCHTPLLEGLKHRGMLLGCEPCEPQDDTHVLRLGIADKLMQVDVGIGGERITC